MAMRASCDGTDAMSGGRRLKVSDVPSCPRYRRLGRDNQLWRYGLACTFSPTHSAPPATKIMERPPRPPRLTIPTRTTTPAKEIPTTATMTASPWTSSFHVQRCYHTMLSLCATSTVYTYRRKNISGGERIGSVWSLADIAVDREIPLARHRIRLFLPLAFITQ